MDSTNEDDDEAGSSDDTSSVFQQFLDTLEYSEDKNAESLLTEMMLMGNGSSNNDNRNMFLAFGPSSSAAAASFPSQLYISATNDADLAAAVAVVNEEEIVTTGKRKMNSKSVDIATSDNGNIISSSTTAAVVVEKSGKRLRGNLDSSKNIVSAQPQQQQQHRHHSHHHNHCKERPEATLKGVDAFVSTLSSFKIHVSEKHSAICWLVQHGDPSRSIVSVPKEFRYPPILMGPGIERDKKGTGGYAQAFTALGMWRSATHLSQGHFHHWYYPKQFDQNSFQQAMMNMQQEALYPNITTASIGIQTEPVSSSASPDMITLVAPSPSISSTTSSTNNNNNNHHHHQDLPSIPSPPSSSSSSSSSCASTATQQAMDTYLQTCQSSLDELKVLVQAAQHSNLIECNARDRLRNAIQNRNTTTTTNEVSSEELFSARANAQQSQLSLSASVEKFQKISSDLLQNGNWEDINTSIGQAFRECQLAQVSLAAAKQKVCDLEERFRAERSSSEMMLIAEERRHAQRAELTGKYLRELEQCLLQRKSVYDLVHKHCNKLGRLVANMAPIPELNLDDVINNNNNNNNNNSCLIEDASMPSSDNNNNNNAALFMQMDSHLLFSSMLSNPTPLFQQLHFPEPIQAFTLN